MLSLDIDLWVVTHVICSYIEVLEYIETFLVNLFMAILFTIGYIALGYIAFIDRCLNVYLST